MNGGGLEGPQRCGIDRDIESAINEVNIKIKIFRSGGSNRGSGVHEKVCDC